MNHAITTALYHVTSVESSKSALLEGLKGGTKPRNRGETLRRKSIFALLGRSNCITDNVAAFQIWPWQNIGRYAVLRIDPRGITGRVVDDDCGEVTSSMQLIIEQPLIEAKYLSLDRIRRFNYPGEAILKIQSEIFQRRLTSDELHIAERWLSDDMVDHYHDLASNNMLGRLGVVAE